MTWRPVADLRNEVMRPDEIRKPTNPASMKTFREKLARANELPRVIPKLERFEVEWCYKNFGYQFKFAHGPILCWWPRTGAVYWQGKNLNPGLVTTTVEEAIDGLSKSLSTLRFHKVEGLSNKLKLADLPANPVCLVCGSGGVELTCDTCASRRDDLCSECWKIAHWCHPKETCPKYASE